MIVGCKEAMLRRKSQRKRKLLLKSKKKRNLRRTNQRRRSSQLFWRLHKTKKSKNKMEGFKGEMLQSRSSLVHLTRVIKMKKSQKRQ